MKSNYKICKTFSCKQTNNFENEKSHRKKLKKSKSDRRYVYSVDREVNCFLRNNRDSDRNDDASNRFS